MTTNIYNKTWDDHYKIAARQDTVINQVKKFLDNKSIPINKQYWTLCGRCDRSGTELDHLLTEKIITSPSQFYGVEINKEIYAGNVIAEPRANFINNDLIAAMKEKAIENSFNPIVINADTNYRIKKAVNFTSDIIKLLKVLKKRKVLLITNVVLRHIGTGTSYENFVRSLKQNPDYNEYGKDVIIGPEMYEYKNKATVMGTYYFYI